MLSNFIDADVQWRCNDLAWRQETKRK